ncbi:uncharacterized protein LOC143671124 isoform X1 [Tamandua tetradactyla]|uniref:uncharacterized protein LOC143671124 isoform X1 n=1 Tax=Tamandua tetradactyla TaxID=48850 RepID=UPI004053FE02
MKCLHSNNQSWFSRMNNQKKRKDMEPALPGVYCLKRKLQVYPSEDKSVQNKASRGIYFDSRKDDGIWNISVTWGGARYRTRVSGMSLQILWLHFHRRSLQAPCWIFK